MVSEGGQGSDCVFCEEEDEGDVRGDQLRRWCPSYGWLPPASATLPQVNKWTWGEERAGWCEGARTGKSGWMELTVGFEEMRQIFELATWAVLFRSHLPTHISRIGTPDLLTRQNHLIWNNRNILEITLQGRHNQPLQFITRERDRNLNTNFRAFNIAGI